MKLGYYPGCSLHGTSREFDESFRAVAAALGVELKEIDDWSCCGASSAHPTEPPARRRACRRATWRSPRRRGSTKSSRPAPPASTASPRPAHEMARTPRSPATSPEDPRRGRSPTTWPCSTSSTCCSSRAGDRRAGRRVTPRRSRASRSPATTAACWCGRPRSPASTTPSSPRTHGRRHRGLRRHAGRVEHGRECCGGALLDRPHRLGGAPGPRASSTTRASTGADAIVVACPMCHSNLDLRQGAMALRGDGDAGLSRSLLSSPKLVGLALGLSRRDARACSATSSDAARRRREPVGAASRGRGRARRHREAATDGPHRRLRLSLRREHRPHRRLSQRRRRGARATIPASSSRPTTSTCAPTRARTLVRDAIEEHNLDRRRRRRLLAAHAREDLPPRRDGGRPQPLHVRDGQHPRALLLGPRGQGRGHAQGDRHRAHDRREGQAQPAARAHPHPRHQARAGHRRRHRRHPGGARHRRRRHRGRAGREGRRPSAAT